MELRVVNPRAHPLRLADPSILGESEQEAVLERQKVRLAPVRLERQARGSLARSDQAQRHDVERLAEPAVYTLVPPSWRINDRSSESGAAPLFEEVEPIRSVAPGSALILVALTNNAREIVVHRLLLERRESVCVGRLRLTKPDHN